MILVRLLEFKNKCGGITQDWKQLTHIHHLGGAGHFWSGQYIYIQAMLLTMLLLEFMRWGIRLFFGLVRFQFSLALL